MQKVAAVLILFFLLNSASVCFADVSISVITVDGSNSLRFERTPVAGQENKKELHVRVSSANGGRFQVFQRMLDPITNEKGESLNLQAIETQTLPNSNSTGTLYLQNSDHLSMGDQLLYSSSQSGQSDSFIIGYVINPTLMNASGTFRGRLIFTIRGTGGSNQVIMDVLLDNPSHLQLSVKGAHNQNRLRIQGSDTTQEHADSVNISFSGNSGQEIRIYSQVDELAQNEMGQELGKDTLRLDAQGNTEGLRVQATNGLIPSRSLIYSSTKEQDSFVIFFLANADGLQHQDAGIYSGKIKYVVETNQATQEFPFDIQFNVPPVFTMTVTPPPGGVKFSHVLASNPPQEKQVVITVLSNLHKSYQVLQYLETGMTNQQGKEFNNKYFNLQVEIPPGQRGQTNFTEFSPVQTGECPIFSSDSRGSGASFTVVYRLKGYPQMSPGDFSTPIRFSLNQK